VHASSLASSTLADLSGTRAVLLEPVMSSGRVVAVLAIGWTEPVGQLDQRLAGLVTTLADEASAALSAAVLREQLESLATTDPLTGLANRRGWYEQLQVLSADARRHGDLLTLAIADLDHFKTYNDTFGHEAGDLLLREFADVTVELLREGDLLARWGGEEFAIALPGSDEPDAAAALERLRLSVPGGQTCSFGLATWDGVESLTSCLARADQALYRAKSNGRNQVAS
jgi:diguanylate cyclase (GGDEF)-like protein